MVAFGLSVRWLRVVAARRQFRKGVVVDIGDNGSFAILIATMFPSILRHPAIASALLLTCSNVFMTFAVYYMGQPPKLDFLWAGLCMLGAVYFMFRS